MVYMKILTMPIDNNACERGFKPFVNGSKTSPILLEPHGSMARVGEVQRLWDMFDDSPELSEVIHLCVEQHQDHTGGSVAEPDAEL